MSIDKLYQAPLAPIETLLSTLGGVSSFQQWHEYLLNCPEPYERVCLDRYILILDRLLRLRLHDCSLLDLGCASGFFASAFAVTIAGQVTAVDDARALAFGYNDRAFLPPLREFVEQHGLRHVEVIDTSVESFLGQHAGHRQWDAVLCLSVLHHYLTGYGDRQDVGALQMTEMQAVYRRLGAVTRHALYLEVDGTRIGDQEQFFGDLCELGEFGPPTAVGWSCSAPGMRRTTWELRKLHAANQTPPTITYH